MKTAMKKVLSLSLVLVLLLGIFPVAAFATETGEDVAAADAGVAPADAGVAPADAGVAPADAGVAPADAGVAPADAGVAPTDAGVAPTDADMMIPSADDQDFVIPEGNEDQVPAEAKFGKDDGKDKDKRPGKDEDKRPGKDEDKRPGNEDDSKEEPVAPTSLTVNFYVDNVLVETDTYNAAASIQELINACCNVDDSTTVYYSGARVDSNPCDLGDVVALGQEAHIYLYTQTTEVEPTPDPKPTVCSVCEAEAINGMCTGCYLDEVDCTCAQTGTPDNNLEKYTLILDYNYRGAKKTTMKVDRDAKIIDLIASIPAPTRDGHQFSHWTMDADGADLIDEEVVTRKGTTIYAQWDDDLAVGGKLTLRVDLNYDHQMGESIVNIKKGTKMTDILDYVPTPTRWKYKFDGWYWDRKCTEDVSHDDRLYNNSTIYAKWERRKTNNEIMLKIYLNGNTKSVAKVVDMYEYARDGKISISEVKEAVSAYYTSKDSDGLEFSGLFEAEGWSEYVANRKHTKGEKRIYVNEDDDTTVYVMVYNAKVRTSSSSGTADTSNPKTGDMIFTAVTVMGASAACLATLLYLNSKKRSV